MDTAAVGKYIRTKRIEQRMTQLALANLLGISPQAVSKWERGESLPDVTLFPDIAKIFGLSIEDILRAGKAEKVQPQSLVNAETFAKIHRNFLSAVSIKDLSVPSDVFMLLSDTQKEELLRLLFDMDGGLSLIEEIYRHLSPKQRETVVQNILERKAYEILEPLIPFMTKSIKTIALEHLLIESEFDFLEELLPYLNREQKEVIINFVMHNNLDMEILEDFTPFFDLKLRKIMRRN